MAARNDVANQGAFLAASLSTRTPHVCTSSARASCFVDFVATTFLRSICVLNIVGRAIAAVIEPSGQTSS